MQHKQKKTLNKVLYFSGCMLTGPRCNRRSYGKSLVDISMADTNSLFKPFFDLKVILHIGCGYRLAAHHLIGPPLTLDHFWPL